MNYLFLLRNKKLLKYIKRENIPNIISLVRIILILPIIYFLEIRNLNYVWLLFLIAGISDYLDGFFARKFNQISKIGAIIDPLADKVIIIIPLIWLCKQNLIPYWSLALITLRELIITALRSSKNNGMPALKFAKYKTLFLFFSLILIFSPFEEINTLTLKLGLILYWLGFALNIISFIAYLPIKNET